MKILFAGVALLAVASCNRPDAPICENPPTVEQSQQAVTTARQGDQQAGAPYRFEAPATIQFMRDCVHRTAYRFAGAAEPARIVAESAADYCEKAITDAALLQSRADEKVFGDRAPYTYEQLVANMTGEMQRSALAYVVQARAGHCAVPR